MVLKPVALNPPGHPPITQGVNPRRIVMTSFGYHDAGGGTTVPRLVSQELARRGWEVTVFHAAVPLTPSAIPYELTEREENGVRLIGVHNRRHGLFDLQHPLRELDDPPISAAFAATLDRLAPDVVHFHNLHNLGARLIDLTAVRGIPAFFSTHNYWLICPRAYLIDGGGAICAGPGDGARCARCTGHADATATQRRLAEIRARAAAGLSRILAVSDAVRATLLNCGYDPALVDVVRQAMPHEAAIWEQVGSRRPPGRADPAALTVAFLGSAYAHKGPQLLVAAAQQTTAPVRVKILGEVPDRVAAHLRALDRRGVVEIHGRFDPDQIGPLLTGVDAAALPSTWWDCAPLAAAECHAARVPLLVPRLGGLAETVVPGDDGLTFEALDPDDLARQLDRLAGEPGLLERLQAGIAAPRAFAAYVDELERYYAGALPTPQHVRTTLAGDPPAVRWQGEFGQPTSLSIINDRVSERLGAAYALERVSPAGQLSGPPLPHCADVEVRHQWPPDLSPARAGRLAAIVPWEFGAVPVHWLEQIQRNVDELWVPSRYVAEMYSGGGIDPARIQVIPNGVDLERFHPGPPRTDDGHTRFLFVGGLIPRKGPDLLLAAWRRAFPGRADVTLVIKDFGADGLYRGADRGPIRSHAASGALPRIELHEETLSAAALAELYRSADVLVTPYRGEGFAMPVLEAMASGLAVIATAGGPSDEFCPPEAGWRIRSTIRHYPRGLLGGDLTPAADPWMLEPDPDHLVTLLQHAHAEPEERRRRGAAGRRAAQALSWEQVAARYRERLTALADTFPTPSAAARIRPARLNEPVALRVLATPAWAGAVRGAGAGSGAEADDLAGLLTAWAAATHPETSACLYLLADPDSCGGAERVHARVLAAAAAAGVDLDACADINVLISAHTPDRDARLHAAADVYVPLHAACAGHVRLAHAHGSAVLTPGELAAQLAAPAPVLS
jgi:glycosyltransferase involved in cell wall biosynthesis